MTKKEKAKLQQVFSNGMLHIFATNEEAMQVKRILEKNKILHTLGEYLRDVDGEMAYRLGIEIARPDKLIQEVFDGVYGEDK